MLKLGYKASAEQFAPRQLLDFAVHAEAVGFDSIMVSDHFQPWRHTGGHGPTGQLFPVDRRMVRHVPPAFKINELSPTFFWQFDPSIGIMPAQ